MRTAISLVLVRLGSLCISAATRLARRPLEQVERPRVVFSTMSAEDEEAMANADLLGRALAGRVVMP